MMTEINWCHATLVVTIPEQIETASIYYLRTHRWMEASVN